MNYTCEYCGGRAVKIRRTRTNRVIDLFWPARWRYLCPDHLADLGPAT